MSVETEPLLTKEELEKKFKEEKVKVDNILKEAKLEEALKGYNDLIKNIEKGIKQNKSLKKEDRDKIIKECLIPCYSNICYINIKQNDWNSVLEKANLILKIDKNNSKALYRKCYAEIHLAEYDQAQDTLFKLNDLIGPNSELRSLKKTLEEKRTRDKFEQMKKYKKMMNYYHKMNEEKEYQEMSKIGKFFYGCNLICKKIFCCCNKRKTIKKTY